jgi:hypothetical protein
MADDFISCHDVAAAKADEYISEASLCISEASYMYSYKSRNNSIESDINFFPAVSISDKDAVISFVSYINKIIINHERMTAGVEWKLVTCG